MWSLLTIKHAPTMHTPRLFLRAAVLLILAAPSVSAQARTPTESSTIRREIDGQLQAMAAAFNKGDVKGAASFYADNAIIASGSGVVASGRRQLDAYFTELSNPKSWKLESHFVTGDNNVAYQGGLSTLVHGDPERTSVVQFLVRWERQRDNTMKIALDYYHSPSPRR